MARKLRKKRVAGALAILILIIGLICFLCFKSCRKDENKNSGNSETETTQSESTEEKQGELEKVWPAEVAEYVKEYKGGGELISVNKSKDDKDRTVYEMKYKGTSVDSCFSYAKDTLGIKGEWTEVVTDEHYTLERDLEKYILNLSCEPKASNGYDFLVKVRLK